jgi:hypothetical protein
MRTSIVSAIVLLGLHAVPGSAQQVAVTGVVRDAESQRPLIGANVMLGIAPSQLTVRTEDDGTFRFTVRPERSWLLTVRRLGYEIWTDTVVLGNSDTSLIIDLKRLVALDTVRVRASRLGIYGVVGRSADFKPLPFATIRVIGPSTKRAQADSSGQFFVAITAPGSYFVRASAPGYESQTLSTLVPPNNGVELALMLDSARVGTNAMEHAYADFEARALRRRNSSAIISRSELRSDKGELLELIRRSPSFGAKVLNFGPVACIFLDGRPQPGLQLSGIDPAVVEAIEVYAGGAEGSGTLAGQWPRRFPCAETGVPARNRAEQPNDIRWVVIWRRR